MYFKLRIVYWMVVYAMEVSGQAWRISTACYGNDGLNCSYHHFQCKPNEHIAVNGAEYFYRNSPRCGMGVANCDVHRQTCCIPQQEDCSLPYTWSDMERLKTCTRDPTCVFRSPWSTHRCVINSQLIQFSSYSVIFYECVEKIETVDFCEGSMVGTSVSVMYDPAKHKRNSDITCACMTSGTDEGHTPIFIEALDVHLGNNTLSGCSYLTMNTEERDFVYSCKTSVMHPPHLLIPVNSSLPIRSELEISKTNPPQRVWMRIQAKRPIKVICRLYNNEQAGVNINGSLAAATSDAVDGHALAIIGGIFGTLLIIGIACISAIVAVKWFRKQKSVSAKKLAHEYFEIEPTNPPSGERNSSTESGYYEIKDNRARSGTDPYYSTADNLGRNSQSVDACKPFVISGYDHLRLKQGNSSPRAPNYGRLEATGAGTPVTDNRETNNVVFNSVFDRASVAV